jgi:hypothetical protein
MKPLHYGILFVGSFLVLIGAIAADSNEKEESKDKKPESPEGDQVNVDEIRRLRRELRHQLTKKKKILPTKGTS